MRSIMMWHLSSKPAAILLAISLAALTPAMAQEAQPAAPAASTSNVDESALRYYARQGDQKRLEAEIARLSAIYPGWVPPKDPLSTTYTPDPEVEAMWDLYSKGDLPAIRTKIADKTAKDPTWRAPTELLEALDKGEAAAQLRAASETGNNEEVITAAANSPDMLVCANMDLLWRVAQAFVDTDREARGVDLYTYILQNCDNPAERLATMQKAMGLLDRTQFETLFAYERKADAGASEFAPIRVDLARASVADALNGVTLRADPKDLSMLEETGRADRNPDDLRLLGYYYLKQERPKLAMDWFTMAVDKDGSEDSVIGLSIAQMQLGEPAAAEELLATYRKDSPALEKQYLAAAASLLSQTPAPSLDPATLSRIAGAASDARDAATAQSLGWYAYGFGQSRTAADWFRVALKYDPDYEPAAYGLILAAQKLKDTATVKELMKTWADRSPRIGQFGKRGAPTTAPTVYQHGMPIEAFVQDGVFRGDADAFANGAFLLMAERTPAQLQAAQRCATNLPPESFSAAQALPRAWCLMDMDRATEAEAAFRRATQSASVKIRTDAYYGQALALLRMGLTNDASVAASAMPQTQDRLYELQVAILTQTATSYFDIGHFEEALQALDIRSQYAAEQNDLLTIRAWCYFHLGRLREARQLFAAVAATGYTDAQRGLDASNARGFNN
jgi:tetratricopeptide (TPR) repeat protein